MIRPLWIEVDLEAIKKNYTAIRKVVGADTAIVATIKQHAYGHGLIPVARQLGQYGADFFGVGSIEEAVTLREDGFDGRILILTAVLEDFADYFIRYNITPTVPELSFAKKLNKAAELQGVKVPVHVKIDTGMGRLGLHYDDAFPFVEQLTKLSSLVLEGIYTHFPAADSDPDFTKKQIGYFNDFIRKLESKKIRFTYRHCANSIGVLNYPNAHFNMVRPGLILYGVSPDERINIDVTPALALKSKVIFVKSVSKGARISYGRTYATKKAGHIATVAIGYADGYPWALSNRSQVIINDTVFPIAGRVCMDHIMIDVGSAKNVCAGTEVILLGASKHHRITAEDLALWANTIPYEIISRLSLKIPRIYK